MRRKIFAFMVIGLFFVTGLTQLGQAQEDHTPATRNPGSVGVDSKAYENWSFSCLGFERAIPLLKSNSTKGDPSTFAHLAIMSVNHNHETDPNDPSPFWAVYPLGIGEDGVQRYKLGLSYMLSSPEFREAYSYLIMHRPAVEQVEIAQPGTSRVEAPSLIDMGLRFWDSLENREIGVVYTGSLAETQNTLPPVWFETSADIFSLILSEPAGSTRFGVIPIYHLFGTQEESAGISAFAVRELEIQLDIDLDERQISGTAPILISEATQVGDKLTQTFRLLRWASDPRVLNLVDNPNLVNLIIEPARSMTREEVKEAFPLLTEAEVSHLFKKARSIRESSAKSDKNTSSHQTTKKTSVGVNARVAMGPASVGVSASGEKGSLDRDDNSQEKQEGKIVQSEENQPETIDLTWVKKGWQTTVGRLQAATYVGLGRSDYWLEGSFVPFSFNTNFVKQEVDKVLMRKREEEAKIKQMAAKAAEPPTPKPNWKVDTVTVVVYGKKNVETTRNKTVIKPHIGKPSPWDFIIPTGLPPGVKVTKQETVVTTSEVEAKPSSQEIKIGKELIPGSPTNLVQLNDVGVGEITRVERFSIFVSLTDPDGKSAQIMLDHTNGESKPYETVADIKISVINGMIGAFLGSVTKGSEIK